MWGPIRFYRESRSYMQGYSDWHFFKRLPRALCIFYYLAFRDSITLAIYRMRHRQV